LQALVFQMDLRYAESLQFLMITHLLFDLGVVVVFVFRAQIAFSLIVTTTLSLSLIFI
jgi:hypothetical protein